MKRCVSLPICISSSVLLLCQTASTPACQTGSLAITNLPAISGANYQVSDLNQAGQLTGSFYISGVQPLEAFVYGNGALTGLGTLGGSTSQGTWINSSGQVVGQADLPGGTQSHAFLYSAGSMADLGTLGGPISSASAVNDAAVVIGNSDLAGGDGTWAFIYTNTAMVNLGNLGSNFTSAFAINNSSLVVGESGTSSGALHAFAYSNGILSDLGTLGGDYSAAFVVNDSGVMVGESLVNSTDIHGFVYSGGTMTDVGTFGGTYSSGYLVNSNGQASGVANITGDAETHGFIYSGGILTDLGTFGGIYTFPNAMNNLGQIAGEALDTNGNFRAFLWQKGTLTDLNTLLPAGSGWDLVSALYINDAGRIVGLGTLAGVSQWFILDMGGSNSAPVAVVQAPQTVDCQAQATLDASLSSDPDNDTLSFQWSSGGTVLGTNAVLTVSLPLGTNTVTLQVTDGCGASTQTNVTVVVADTTPPVGSCPAAATASADGNCQAVVPNFAAEVTATDNCTPSSALTITQSPLPGTLVGLGPHPVTITVTDGSGNSSTCSVLFTVVDTTPPTIISLPATFTLSADAGCQAQVPNILPNVAAVDSCTPANLLVKTQSPAAGTSIGLGSHSILVTVTDAAGNSATASVAFTVADTTPPSILSGPSSIKLSADANCQAAMPNVLSQVLVTDNCTPANQIVLTQTPAAGTVLPRGVYSVVVKATDASGNSSSLSIPLEIDDTMPPVILNHPAQVTVSADANCQAVVPNVLANVLATDNCTPAGQLVMTQNPPAGTVLPRGQYQIAVSVTDASGNAASVNIPLAIVDTTPPVILNHPAQVTVSADTNCQAVVPNVLANVLATDNCTPAGQLVMTQNPPAGTVLPRGQYQIAVSVADASGNVSSVNIPLAIVNTTGPVFQALAVSPNVLSPPNHQLVPVTVSALVTDNCDSAPVVKIVSITCDEPTSPNDMQITGNLTANLAASKDSSGNPRVYTITVQATDASGNSSTGQVIVVVPKNGSTGTVTITTRILDILSRNGSAGFTNLWTSDRDDNDRDDRSGLGRHH